MNKSQFMLDMYKMLEGWMNEDSPRPPSVQPNGSRNSKKVPYGSVPAEPIGSRPRKETKEERKARKKANKQKNNKR